MGMDPRRLERYRPLYRSTEKMGSGEILRRYLSLDPSILLPLSISHGVDMNHCSTAMDVDSPEPIHWSYNEHIHRRASERKTSILLPHPWLMLMKTRTAKAARGGVLVIGPPPGSSNDRNLLASLRRHGIAEFDVLVKQRGDTSESATFWKAEGIRTITAGTHDAGFYERLLSIVDGYEYIVGCTLSSALFFAAALGKKCSVLTDYSYSAYETPDYLHRADFSSPIARSFVRHLSDADHAGATALALDVLGASLQGDTSHFRTTLLHAVANVDRPIHHASGSNWLVRCMGEALALQTGKAGLITATPWALLSRRMENRVCVITLNEIDMWIAGVTSANFMAQQVRYVPRRTEPGWAVD
jgi:hypothetical protein